MPLRENFFIDIHTHKSDNKDNSVIQIKSIFASEASMYLFSKNEKTSIGIHPWNIEKTDVEKALQDLERLASRQNVLAIGETGLDRLCDASLEKQVSIFKKQAAIAEQVKKPVIIHCVKAYSEIISLRKQLSPAMPWIIHGFYSADETARQLLQHGIYLSFGAMLFRKNSKIIDVLSDIPDDMFFLETDDSDFVIRDIYRAVSEIKKMENKDLKKIIYSNFRKVFS